MQSVLYAYCCGTFMQGRKKQKEDLRKFEKKHPLFLYLSLPFLTKTT